LNRVFKGGDRKKIIPGQEEKNSCNCDKKGEKITHRTITKTSVQLGNPIETITRNLQLNQKTIPDQNIMAL